MKRLFLALVLTVLLPASAYAEAAAQFQTIGLRAPDDPDVGAFRFSILYASNSSVSGLDLGLANFAEQDSFSGVGFVMGVLRTSGDSSGCHCAMVGMVEGTSTGVNGAFVNIVNTIESGANVGFLNLTEGSSSVDIGGLSMSESSGVQVGFVNFTDEIQTLQIGFLNFAPNGIFPVLPLFNYPK